MTQTVTLISSDSILDMEVISITDDGEFTIVCNNENFSGEWKFTYKVSNEFGSSQAEETVTVLRGRPIINTQPQDTEVVANSPFIFSIDVSDEDKITWYKDAVKISPEENGTIYTSPATTPGQNDYYAAYVENANGGYFSRQAQGYARDVDIIITVQPQSGDVTIGDTIQLSVTDTGATNYQWFVKNSDGSESEIAGETLSSYESDPTTVMSNVEIFCRLSNITETEDSDNAHIQIVAAPIVIYTTKMLHFNDSETGVISRDIGFTGNGTIKIKLTAAANAFSARTILSAPDAISRIFINWDIGSYGKLYFSSPGLTSLSKVLPHLVKDNNFHVFRFVQFGTSFKCYLDDVQFISNTGLYLPNLVNNIHFGHNNNGNKYMGVLRELEYIDDVNAGNSEKWKLDSGSLVEEIAEGGVDKITFTNVEPPDWLDNTWNVPCWVPDLGGDNVCNEDDPPPPLPPGNVTAIDDTYTMDTAISNDLVDGSVLDNDTGWS